MQLPAYNHRAADHALIITTAVITPASARQILAEEFGYTVVLVGRSGAVVRIEERGRARWAFVVNPDDAQLMTGSTQEGN